MERRLFTQPFWLDCVSIVNMQNDEYYNPRLPAHACNVDSKCSLKVNSAGVHSGKKTNMA